jgi:hypothetical protein
MPLLNAGGRGCHSGVPISNNAGALQLVVWSQSVTTWLLVGGAKFNQKQRSMDASLYYQQTMRI